MKLILYRDTDIGGSLGNTDMSAEVPTKAEILIKHAHVLSNGPVHDSREVFLAMEEYATLRSEAAVKQAIQETLYSLYQETYLDNVKIQIWRFLEAYDIPLPENSLTNGKD